MNPQFMQQAIELALAGIHSHGNGPFGAVIVKDGHMIAQGTNQVTKTLDPTAHAEVCAIRSACLQLKTFSLVGCEIYTSCEPCPMCLAAIFWARLDKVYYGATRADAALANFDDSHFYEEIKKTPELRFLPMVQMMHKESLKLFESWRAYEEKVPY